MLDDGAIDGSTQVRMLVCDDACFVTNAVIYVLELHCLWSEVELARISIPAGLPRLETDFQSGKVLE